MGEWRTISIDQLGRVVTGKTPPTSEPLNYGSGIPFVTPSDMDGQRFVNSTGRLLTPRGVNTVLNARIPAGSVMVSCIGSDMGKTAIAAHECVTNQQINSIVVYNYYSPLFVYYNLSQRKNEIRLSASGSAQPIMNKTTFGKLKLMLPVERSEQESIASILGSLDDKIDLNRRMNETFESIARAIFKDWFVDFGPTRAKMEGRAPYLAPEIWELFPDRLDEEGKPEGWNERRVEQIAEKVAMGPFGSSIKVSTFVDAGVPVISGQHLNNVKIEDSTYNFITKEHANKLKNSIALRGDIVFTHAGNIGQVSYIDNQSMYEKYILSQRQFLLRCNVHKTTPEYIVYYFRSADGQSKILANSSSTGVPSISRPVSYLKTISFILPDTNVIGKFSDLIRTMHQKTGILKTESKALAQTRDLLLPKLMSGEIRVKDAEKTVEKVL